MSNDTIGKNEKYQTFYLRKAIAELLNEKKDSKSLIQSTKDDHLNGHNFINNIKIPLTFPMYLLNYIDNLSKKKEYDYNFIGVITKKREWVEKYNNEYSIIEQSGRGRDKKYTIDKNYYNILSKSKFTITPTGDCPWSYRFFEAIMCLSIPILENNSNDIHMKDYFCLFDKDEHIYDEGKAIQNYNKFIKSKHFLRNVPELEFLRK